MSIFEGSPAYKKGLRRGDVIARIAGAEAKGWTSEQAVAKLKGPKGTTVNISLRRRGYDGLIDLDVERDEVNIVTVRGAFMVDKDTGYIKLGDFSETSDDEVGAALKKLTDSGMKRLVFDLRDNPGGPLDQAIKIANRFLPKGDMIVYTRGRIPRSDEDYRAQEDSQYTHLPMVVLVNRNSASASEIVTGSLQDHDRALVVGETTFGKALVQSVYRISGNAGLALTTGRYYTPSGRMIQRPWDGTFDEYLTYSLRDQNPQREHSAAQLKKTDAGRDVYSGGGIDPDKFMVGSVEGFNPSRFGRTLVGPRRLRELRRSVHGRRRYASQRGEQEQEAHRERVPADRRDDGGIPGLVEAAQGRHGRCRLHEGRAVHQGHDSLRHRSGALRRGRGPAQPDREGSSGAIRPGSVPGRGSFNAADSAQAVGHLALHFGV